MSQRSYRWLLVGFVSLCAVILFSEWLSQSRERSLLLSYLPQTQETATVNNDSLRLEQVLHEIKTSPRFSLSATDLKDLESVIEEFSTVRETYQTLYPNRADQEAIAANFFPTSFLSELTTTEALRREAIETRSRQSVEAYLASLQTALESYDSYVGSVLAYTESAEHFPLGYLDGFVTQVALTDWLTNLRQAAIVAREWHVSMLACLDEFTVSCNTTFPALQKAPSVAEVTTNPELDSVTFIHEFVTHENPLPPTGGNGEPLAQVPYIEHAGQCAHENKPHTARLWWNQSRNSALPYVRFANIDEILFFSHVVTDRELSREMVRRGFPYQFQSINHYLCTHYASDLSALTTAYQMWSGVNATSSLAFIDTAWPLEVRLTHATHTISTSEIDDYLLAIDSLMRSPEGEELTKDKRAHYEALLLAYRDRSAYLADRLNSVINIHKYSLANFTYKEPPMAETIILTFSALPMTLQSDNKTVVTGIEVPVRPYPPNQSYPNHIIGITALRDVMPPGFDVIEYLHRTIEVDAMINAGTF